MGKPKSWGEHLDGFLDNITGTTKAVAKKAVDLAPATDKKGPEVEGQAEFSAHLDGTAPAGEKAAAAAKAAASKVAGKDAVTAAAGLERKEAGVKITTKTKLSELRAGLNPLGVALTRFNHQVKLDKFVSKSSFDFPKTPGDFKAFEINIAAEISAHFEKDKSKWTDFSKHLELNDEDEELGLKSVMGAIFANSVAVALKKRVASMKSAHEAFKKNPANKGNDVTFKVVGTKGDKVDIVFTPTDFNEKYEAVKAAAITAREGDPDFDNSVNELANNTPVGRLLKFMGYKMKPKPPAVADPKAKYFEDVLSGNGLLGGHLFASVLIEMFGFGDKFGIDIVGPGLALLPGNKGEELTKQYEAISKKARGSKYGIEGYKGKTKPYKKVGFYAVNELIKGGKSAGRGIEFKDGFDTAGKDLIATIGKGGVMIVPEGKSFYANGDLIKVPKGEIYERTDTVPGGQVVLSGVIPKGAKFSGNVTLKWKTPEGAV